MGRLLVLPFCSGCFCRSSVSNPKKTKTQRNPPSTRGECISDGKKKVSLSFNFSACFPRMTKSFKNFYRLFAYKEEDSEAVEMEIGFPTDVKHVTHIGWDGSTATTTMKGWDDPKDPDLPSLRAISLGKFELAMATQADVTHANSRLP